MPWYEKAASPPVTRLSFQSLTKDQGFIIFSGFKVVLIGIGFQDVVSAELNLTISSQSMLPRVSCRLIFSFAT